MSVSVSVLTLTFIAYDRFHAICNPLEFNPRTDKATIVIGTIWSMAGLIALPAIGLESVSPLSKDDYPCRDDHILFDLSTCKPSWETNTDFLLTLIKVSGFDLVRIRFN